jgi:hypothetical protein
MAKAAKRAHGKPSVKSGSKSDGDEADLIGAYKALLLFQFGATVLLAGVIAIVLWVSFKGDGSSPPLLPLVVGAGMLGALFSALIRLYNVDEAGNALVTPTIQKLGPYLIL